MKKINKISLSFYFYTLGLLLINFSPDGLLGVPFLFFGMVFLCMFMIYFFEGTGVFNWGITE